MSQLQQSSYSSRKLRRPNVFSGALLAVLLLVFLAAFGYASYLFFQTTRAIILNAPQLNAGDQIPAGEVVQGQEIGSELVAGVAGDGSSGESDSALSSLLSPIWNEQEPINILLLGIDQRPGEQGYHRTDTMIVVNIDPQTGNIGMLSMPRDLWVDVPGYWETRINSAHYIGDSEKHPGGGAALTKETVSQFLGQPIHYFVRINFEGFRALLEEVGCIDVNVPQDINDPEFPDDNYGFDPFYIAAGQHCMDADTALKYARTRHADSDFGRMQRQQQVLVAMKDSVLNAGKLPQLISRMPAILGALSDSLQTDMPMSQQITLANMIRKLNIDHIRRLVIDQTMTRPEILSSGAYVLMPNMEAIQPAVDAFFNSEAIPAPEPLDSREAELARENARIAVLNGSSSPDLGRQTAEWLASQGFTVIGYGEADRSDYAQTQIIDYAGKAYTVQELIEIFAVIDENIRVSASTNDQADIQVIIGADFVLPAS